MKSPSKGMLGLSAKKQALLRSMLKTEGATATSDSIPRRDESMPAPLSFAQQRLWFLDQLQPHQPHYNLGAVWSVQGALDLGVLSDSLDALVARHEVLRTCFSTVDGQPVQVVMPLVSVPLPWIDLRDYNLAERGVAVETHLRDFMLHPFDLTTGPLFRAEVLQLDAHEYVVALVFHHSICDGWSIRIVAQDLAALYTAAITGQPNSMDIVLPSLPIQYADYAVWQRQQLQGTTLERLLSYWRQQLAGAPDELALLTDFQRPAMLTHHGASMPLRIDAEVTAGLRAITQSTGSTLFMTLLTAWAVVLARHAGQSDVLVGSPIAGRTRREAEPLIGMFVNTLVLRVDLGGNPSFRTALERVREMCLDAYAHEDLPFEYLVELLQPERQSSRMPLAQVLFQLHSHVHAQPDFAGLVVRPLSSATVSAKFDLELELSDGPEGLNGHIIYSTDLFMPETISRMAGQLQTALRAVAADPTLPVAAIPLLSAAERHAVLVAWNATACAVPPGLALHDLVLAQARRTPDACAIRCGSEQWSYRELVLRAEAIAEQLHALGAGPEVRVGVWMGRSAELVAGLLGILLAGAAYLPLDPAYPPARVAFMLADAGAGVVLTEAASAATLPGWSGPVLRLEDVPRQPTTPRVRPPVDGDHLAYVIYTSGSTGQPKGVAITHANAVALVSWAHTIFDPAELAGVLAATSICFDLSVFELFVPLAQGGSVILVADALHLATLPPTMPVTLVNTVPSVLREVLRVTTLPRSVRVVNLAGEALPAALVMEVYRQGGIAAVYNLYGPSEDTTYSTWARMEREQVGAPPIGRPIANTQAYVLDEWMEPVPVGVAGELYLGGAGVARGYVNRPEVTAARFVPDPFGQKQGGRLYRTGDLVRYRGDGDLDYLGRIDQQVKIRGFRIELGEIEAVLNAHPDVAESVVVVRTDLDLRLVAYLVGEQQTAGEPRGQRSSELRAYLQERLPDYMVPAAFVVLASLPLTPNGKVDRQALPAPDYARPDLDHPFVPPRTPDEAELAAIWADALQVKRIGVYDNFFDLGGHSLAAVTVVMCVRSAFQIDLPLRYVFEAPTIAQLAQVIELRRQGEAGDTLSAFPTLDLWSDVVLDPSITAGGTSGTLPTDPAVIMLTGATGFLGAYLLHDLLQATSATIFCLVRSRSMEAASAKLRANLAHYQLWDDRFAARIVPLLGDLARPLFGLDPAQFATLAETIDVIYHNGALVNSVYPYAVLKAPNVGGTHEALRLATQGKLKPLHFISTSSVFSAQVYGDQVAREADTLGQYRGLSSGYAQSKWVAEQLVMLARERGVPVRIYRPGRIGWDQQTGLWNIHDTLYKILKGCLQLGSAPLMDVRVEVWPVDLVSKAVVHISRQPESVGQAFHLVNPLTITWNDLVQAIQALGYPLRQLAFNEWLAELQSELAHTTDPTLQALRALVPAQGVEAEAEPLLAQVQFDVCQAEARLAGTAIGWTPLDLDLIRPLLDRLSAV